MAGPDNSFQEFKGATPEGVVRILDRVSTRVTHKAYVEEVATHLEEMNVGDTRVIPNPPRTLRVQNLLTMLEVRGWYKNKNFVYGKLLDNPLTHERYAIYSRPYFFKKTSEKGAQEINSLHGVRGTVASSTRLRSQNMNHSTLTPAAKRSDIKNRNKLLELMEEHSLTRLQISAATGYSIDSIRGFTMPDRTSARAKRVTDRFIRLLELAIPEYLERQKAP